MTDRKMKLMLMAHVRFLNAEVQYALDLAVEFEKRGHEVVFFAEKGSLGAVEAVKRGLAVHEESGFNDKGAKALFSAPAAMSHLSKKLSREKFDAVLVFRSEGFPLICWAAKRAGVKVVRIRGDMRPVRSDPINRMLYARGADAVVTTNLTMQASLRERIGEIERQKVIHGGVDPDLFTPDGPVYPVREEFGIGKDSLLIGILGRLCPVKGHGDLLDAMGIALEEGANVDLVILRKLSEELPDEISSRLEGSEKLRSRVHMMGHVDELPPVLRAFDLGIITSVGSEANCRVGLEWMGCEVGLLATRVGVLPDIVTEGETGYTVAVANPSELAEKIVYLASDPGEVRRFGQNARRDVLKRFTLSGQCDGYTELLDDILSGRTSSG